MRKHLLTLALGLAVAGSASAAEPGHAAAASGGEKNLRVQLGVMTGNAGAYCNGYGYCNGLYGYYYSSGFLGAEYDMPFSGAMQLTLGGRFMASPGYYSGYYLLEPDVDVTWKFHPPNIPVEPRLMVGLGLFLGSTYYGSQIGAALRLGGGLSFLPHQKLGFGVDLAVDFGGYGGGPFSAVELSIGPEFRF